MELVENFLTLNPYELTIFDHSYNSVVITTPFLEGEHPKILYVNDAFTRMSGYTKEEILGKTPRVLQGPKTDKEVLQRLKKCLKNEEYFEGKTINYTKDAREYWVEWNISPVYDKEKKLIAFLSFQKDISVAQKLLNHIKLFQKAIDQNHDAIALFNGDGDYIYVNESYVKRTGYSATELIGKNPKILKSGYHDESFYKNLWQRLLSKTSFETIFCNKNAQGMIYYEKQTITPILEDEVLLGYVTIGKNYDKEQERRKQLEEDVFIDSLTGLFNKRAFDIKLKNRIESFTGSFCMMFVDLDHFTQVNDKMGHDAGDNALRESAIFLRGNIRKSDDIFRFGGDEFVVLLYDTKEKDAQLLSCKLEESFVASDIAKRYGISMSIGSGEYFGEGAEQFLKKTDDEMYRKKRAKKSSWI